VRAVRVRGMGVWVVCVGCVVVVDAVLVLIVAAGVAVRIVRVLGRVAVWVVRVGRVSVRPVRVRVVVVGVCVLGIAAASGSYHESMDKEGGESRARRVAHPRRRGAAPWWCSGWWCPSSRDGSALLAADILRCKI
jgi:hypothetical protein